MITHRLILIVAASSTALGLMACGEEEGGGSSAKSPVISSASISCGPFAGEGDPKVDGDILLRIEAIVSDEDGDLTSVTANYDGALFDLTDDGSGATFTYNQGGIFNEIARCSGSETVTIRAVDALGNVGELKDDAITR